MITFCTATASYDTAYTLLFIAAIAVMIIGMIAQGSVMRTFKRFSNTRAISGKVGQEVATEMLRNGGSRVTVSGVSGTLSDHYNPRTGNVALSEAVYNSDSVAALAVAAHEIGHVMQYEQGYLPIKIRNTILPVASFGSQAGFFLVLIGLFMQAPLLAEIGVILYGAVFLFQLVTLPVEFNASSRGLDMLVSGNYIAREQEADAKKVLRAAAMTYVIAALASLVTFLRLLLIVNGSRRRN